MTQYQKPLDWTAELTSAGPYPIEAYDFVREGLSYTVRQIHEDADRHAEFDRHISGQELCLGLRDFAIDRYALGFKATIGLIRYQADPIPNFR
jgi:uncharacterized repeat protein (TIGR04138 family)